MVTEDTLNTWSQPPSITQQTKADNAERIVRDALKDSPKLAHLDLKVFTQGSYRANTNTRLNSDVDICVMTTESYFYDLNVHKVPVADVGIVPATLQYADFRNLVQQALFDRFGSGVTRGNKAFDVHENTYRLDADIVAAFEQRRYFKRADGRLDWHSGVGFLTDAGHKIENWPNQSYDNGVLKNSGTGRRYKSAIRMIKRLRDQMQSDGVTAADDIGSFLIESLVWNVPNEDFDASSCRGLMQSVLACLWNQTKADATCSEWGEVSDFKYIFRPLTIRERVHTFVDAAWNYVDFN